MDVRLLARNSVELLRLEHVLQDAAPIQIVLLRNLGAQLCQQILNDLLLLLLDLLLNDLLEVTVHYVEELVQQLGNGLLIDVLEQSVDDDRSWGVDVGDQLLLLSVDQKSH